MKKLIFFLALFTAGLVFQSSAQLLKTTKPVKDTCVNTDNTTITLGSIPGDAVAFHLTAAKVSGTVAGNAIFEGSIDGTNWVTLQTTALTDVAVNTITFTPTALSFAQYRIRVTTSGTCKINTIRGHYLKRSKV
jgi:hypothetical protein